MYKLLFCICLFLSFSAGAQSNRERMEDIEDKLDFLILQRQYDEIDSLRRQNDEMRRQNSTARSEWYRNIETEATRNKNAWRFNLSYSEYIRRDEFFTNRCSPNNKLNFKCYKAGMVGITLAEVEKRIKKVEGKCGFWSVEKELEFDECYKKIVVLNK